MTDKNTADHIRTAARQSVRDRKQCGQSPVPSHCIRFDLRVDARDNENPSESRTLVAATIGDADDLVAFGLDDIPENDEELANLLSDEPELEQTNDGWVLVE